MIAGAEYSTENRDYRSPEKRLRLSSLAILSTAGLLLAGEAKPSDTKLTAHSEAVQIGQAVLEDAFRPNKKHLRPSQRKQRPAHLVIRTRTPDSAFNIFVDMKKKNGVYEAATTQSIEIEETYPDGQNFKERVLITLGGISATSWFGSYDTYSLRNQVKPTGHLETDSRNPEAAQDILAQADSMEKQALSYPVFARSSR